MEGDRKFSHIRRYQKGTKFPWTHVRPSLRSSGLPPLFLDFVSVDIAVCYLCVLFFG